MQVCGELPLGVCGVAKDVCPHGSVELSALKVGCRVGARIWRLICRREGCELVQ